MTDKDRNLIAELERRLCWYRDEATEEEFDAEEVDAICVMLQKLSPPEEPHMSKAAAYRSGRRRGCRKTGRCEKNRWEQEGIRERGRKEKEIFFRKERTSGGSFIYRSVWRGAAFSEYGDLRKRGQVVVYYDFGESWIGGSCEGRNGRRN